MWKLVRYQLRGRRLLYTIGLIVMGALTLYQATRFIGMQDNPAQSAPISMNVSPERWQPSGCCSTPS